MRLFKTNNYVYFLLGILLTVTNSYGQVLTKTQQLEFSVKSDANIELNSKYTNIEFELTDNNTVTIEAVMDIEGLSQTEADAYFKKWEFKAHQENNKLVINSLSDINASAGLDKNGYYEGYFLDSDQLDEIILEKKALSGPNQTKNIKNTDKPLEGTPGEFDYEEYIEEGDNYILRWQKENNESVGKRWFNKTKKERILIQKFLNYQETKKINYKLYVEEGDSYLLKLQQENNEAIGERWFNRTKKERILIKEIIRNQQPQKGNKAPIAATEINNSKKELEAKVKKKELSKANVRSLPKRAVINKTLKVKVPRRANLNINVRHGKVIFSDDITNLKADLSYVLLQANKISGTSTSIKGAYTNFEINHWKAGSLDVIFSEFVLIKEVANLNITSNASLVSIDNITDNINAKGNFKMLSVDLSSNIKHANIDVEDSKVVWVKLPNKPYNLSYEGIESKLIHPKKFSLKTAQDNSSKKILETMPLKNNEHFIEIKALASVMQIYEISWDDLKIKSLEGL